jgi:hypothetical protein
MFQHALALVLLLFGPLVLVAVLVILVVSERRMQAGVHTAYTDFAKRVRGQMAPADSSLVLNVPREIRFQHGKTPCLLRVDIEETGQGDSSHILYFMRLVFELGRPADFTCRVQPQSLPKFLAGALRTSDVRLGWDEFDRRFIVEASDELRAPEVLNRPVQEQLLALSQAAAAMSPLEAGHVTLTVRDQRVEIRMKGLLDEAEQLWPFYQLGGGLFDLLAPRV